MTVTPPDHDQVVHADIGEVLDATEVLVCCGSGGVGKTTTAAVLGLEAARRGRCAVVVTIDPARRLADALGLPDGLSAEPQQIELPEADGQLWALMLDTAATFDGLVRRYAADPAQVERIIDNGFYRSIASSLSGTQEYMAAEMLYALHADERFDLVVVDTPPSRNALDFLEAPGVLSRFLDSRVFKLVMLPTRAGLAVVGTASQPALRAIGRVVGSDVLTDAVAFFQAFAGMEGGFRERADDVVTLIRSPETSFVVVASPRHDTIEEAVWFSAQLDRQGVGVDAAIVNRAHPHFGDGSRRDAQSAAHDAEEAGNPELAALWENLAELRAITEAESGVVAPLAASVGPAPLAEVPLLDSDVHDLAGLAAIRDCLFEPGPSRG